MFNFKKKSLHLLILFSFHPISQVQAATTNINAGEVANDITVNSDDSLNINSGGESNRTIVNGGTEAVQSGGIANNTIIENNGSQLVFGMANGTVVNDGDQIIFMGGESYDAIINSEGTQILNYGGVAEGTQLNGGSQVVRPMATVNKTELNNGAAQDIQTDATAENTTINYGKMNLSGGTANNTILIDGEINISSSSVINNTTQSGGIISIQGDGTANNTVSHSGTIYVYGGTNNNNQLSGDAHEYISYYGISDGSILTDSASQTIGLLGVSHNATLAGEFVLQDLIGGSGAAFDTYIMAGVQRISSGSNAYGTVLDGGQQLVYGTTTNTTIQGGLSTLFNGALADGDTQVGAGGQLMMHVGSRATDITLDGTLTVAALNKSPGRQVAQVDSLTMNNGTVAFEAGTTDYYAALNIGELSGSGNFLFNTSLADSAANVVTIGQGSGSFGVVVADSGKEIADHTDLTLNLINDQGGDLDFALQSTRGGTSRAVDGGTYMYVLKQQAGKDDMDGNVWYLGALTDEEGNGGDNNGGDNNGGDNGGGLVTTPSTDAVMNLANAGLNILRGEIDSLRGFRQGRSTDLQHGEGNVWGRYLGKKSIAETSNGAAYKLYQNGMEFGSDITTGFNSGSLIAGGIVSLTGNNVKHARGGASSVDSYGLGAYATWYDNSGAYLDGTLKANRLESKLNARMTNGDSTSGRWNQYGITTALETGFTFRPSDTLHVEPFIRTTGAHINSANVTLSNGMKANTGKARSLTAEAGMRLGSQFSARKHQFAPYLHLGVEQEFVKSNQTTINSVNRFDNNQNGTTGKYGAGLSVQLAENIVLHGEINYRQGSYIEEPVQGSAGIRVAF